MENSEEMEEERKALDVALYKQKHEKLETVVHRKSMKKRVDLLKHLEQDDSTSTSSMKETEMNLAYEVDSGFCSATTSPARSEFSGLSRLSFKSNRSQDFILTFSRCTSSGSASQSDRSKDVTTDSKRAETHSPQDGNMDKKKMERTAKWCEAAGNTLIQQKPNPAPLAPRGRSMPTVANNFGPSSSSSYSPPVASVSPYMPTVANNFEPSSSFRDENMDTWKMEQTEEWCDAAGNTEIQPQPNSATAAPQIPCVPLVANNFGPNPSSIYSAPGPPHRLYMPPFAKNSGLSSAYF
ncbi:Hypothetical predicted protein [Xyrichtys novacula]|uniref:Uncharacterized protein n=1 Tax=Xyrichtys novacula TaxID=13765 RepID=A0AAV1GKP7_XYRNO|nr:Hypothetical predicted protein [Xyrichtys novacula]